MDNLQIAEFRKAITDFIGKSEIPSEVKRMVFREIYDDMSQRAKADLIAEINERDQEEKNE